MEIKPFRGKYPEIVRLLYDQGILARFPIQEDRVDLVYDDGLDIICHFKSFTPRKFAEYSDAILLLAYTLAERYKEHKYKFAKLTVDLNRTTKGRKTINPRREYTAGKHTESEIMVYGEEALGYELPEDYQRRPFLVNKVQEITNIPDTPSPGAYVKKQRPYKVLSLTVSIRAGLKASEVAIAREILAQGGPQ